AISAVYHHETAFGIMQEESPLIPNEFKNWSNLNCLGNTIKLECLGIVRKASIFPMGRNIYKVQIENQDFKVTLANKKISINGSIFPSVGFSQTDEKLYLIKKDCSFEFLIIDSPADLSPDASTGIILSPIHGNISAIYVKLHQNVKAGDKLAILEAMKLQHEIIATTKGKIKVINCSVGAQISADDILMEIETEQ
ncbi:MAG: biotin/lipoyl-containing protein, partial [Pseudomonadota bacterium]|nr:biotin/lipoyl-containing protein [Pseudomonadota bacterium]